MSASSPTGTILMRETKVYVTAGLDYAPAKLMRQLHIDTEILEQSIRWGNPVLPNPRAGGILNIRCFLPRVLIVLH
jgi:hypothetical protein